MSEPGGTRRAPSAAPADVPYRLPWRSVSVRAGAHRAKLEGSGGFFRDFASLLESPDPRRIDLRVSARDPFERLYVRRFEQKAAITVYALIDVSASMGFRGNTDKMELAAELCAAVASSARRIGDAFGLVGCDSGVRPELYVPATRARGGEAEMLQRLRDYVPTGRGTQGLIEAAALIAGRRKLVFLVSDFYMTRAETERIFAALSLHDVVPILLSDTLEVERLPRWGLLSLTDLELGRRRLVVMRPSLRDAWQWRNEARRAELTSIATRFGRAPFEVRDAIDWDRLGAHLISHGGA
jgi:uncharacterized protein (DUF58 family)